MKYVEIYTDGACSGNPGIGGWGAILIYKNNIKEISGGEKLTTNNRMELTAVIEALKLLKEKCNVKITTDSVYVKNGITEWINMWIKNNWKNSNKKEIKNIDLWQELFFLSKEHNIEWEWIKGHNGHFYNEKCDSLARLEILKIKNQCNI